MLIKGDPKSTNNANTNNTALYNSSSRYLIGVMEQQSNVPKATTKWTWLRISEELEQDIVLDYGTVSPSRNACMQTNMQNVFCCID